MPVCIQIKSVPKPKKKEEEVVNKKPAEKDKAKKGEPTEEKKEDVAMPGDRITITAKMDKLVPINKNERFVLREGGKTVAVGMVLNVWPDTEEDIKNEKLKAQRKKAKGVVKGAAKPAAKEAKAPKAK